MAEGGRKQSDEKGLLKERSRQRRKIEEHCSKILI
jgi:hypothetical protein